MDRIQLFRSLLHVLTSPCNMVVSPERAVPRRSRFAFALQVLRGYLLLLAPLRPRL